MKHHLATFLFLMPFLSWGQEFPNIQMAQRFIDHAGQEKTYLGQLRASRREIARRKRLISPINFANENDWALDIGSNGPAAGPGTFYASGSTPSCDDWIAFVIDAQGTSAQANLVFLTNLYVNSVGTGFCAGTAPLVMAAYKVGASAANNRLAPSIWVNSIGTKAVVLEKGTGPANPATIHVITIGTGGTVSGPIAPTGTTLSYTVGGTTNCPSATGTSASADPVIWYASRHIYVGDDSGRLYQLANAFSTPTINFCTTLAAGTKVTDLEPDEGPTPTYVTVVLAGRVLRQVDGSSGTSFIPRWNHAVSSTTNSITDYIQVDGSLNRIYLVSNQDSTGTNAVLEQWDYSGTLDSTLVLGPASSQQIAGPIWDHNYSMNVNASATLYFCTYPLAALGTPTFADVGFDISWNMNSTPSMSGNTNILPVLAGLGTVCNPSFGYYEDDSTSPKHNIDIITGVGTGSNLNPNKVSRWRIQTAAANLSPITNNVMAPDASVTGNNGSVGGLTHPIGDWADSTLGSNTFNIYFGSLAPQTSARGGCGIGSYCFIKLQVAGLN